MIHDFIHKQGVRARLVSRATCVRARRVSRATSVNFRATSSQLNNN
ncbi:MAG: hypothetical protein ACK55Z_23480 [bacterium]